MNDAIKFLSNIQSTMKGWKSVVVVVCATNVVISLGALAISARAVSSAHDSIYLVDQGSILEAMRTTDGAQRDLEAIDHVTRFHELFFNIAPNINTINQNTERALNLADKSAYDCFCALKEKNYYQTLVSINATQQIMVDSVKVDMNVYPYKVKTYSSLYVLRESTITLYTMMSYCDLTEVPRSSTNPHGLMITKFYHDNPKYREQRERN